ncbi:MAG: addiction module protein [Gemmataceae bacterium]|nr:addiction module protein [Gemmataceae bacterium]
MKPSIHDLGINKLSVEQRQSLLDEIWESLELDRHREIIDDRLAEADANPSAGRPWEEVRARLRGQQSQGTSIR